MPKIRINEIDGTSAGTPGRYGNNSVLITGYMGTADPKSGTIITPDENGVYEFTSKGDFLATIGEADVEKVNASGTVTEYHYGNKMAQKLLDLGYTIIYRPIEQVIDMNNELFWAIFKDKASYDFRFISHGLLETCYDKDTHSELYAELTALTVAADKFANMIATVDKTLAAELPDEQKEAAYELEFNRIIAPKGQSMGEGYAPGVKGEGYTGFVDGGGLPVTDYDIAKSLFKAEADGKVSAIDAKQAELSAHNNTHITPEVFNGINGQIAALASYRSDDTAAIPGRGDCIALIELDEDIYCEANPKIRPEALIITGIEAMTEAIGDNGTYCALTVPSVYYKGSIGKMPAAFHYLACYMSSLRSGFAEWYAVAGYTRGVSSYAVDHTSVKLGEIAINALEPRNKIAGGPTFACNVIANFRGSYYLWGNRTAARLNDAASAGGDLTAKHFLNIRQLCTTIKKQLYVSCRRFTFDPNSDILWINFVNAITPTLDAMKADQGIRNYQIIKEPTDVKATLKVRIRVIPIEAVEDFDITVYLEDSFGETSVTTEG